MYHIFQDTIEFLCPEVDTSCLSTIQERLYKVGPRDKKLLLDRLRISHIEPKLLVKLEKQLPEPELEKALNRISESDKMAYQMGNNSSEKMGRYLYKDYLTKQELVCYFFRKSRREQELRSCFLRTVKKIQEEGLC